MAVKDIHFNFLVRNTYEDCIIEFRLNCVSCKAISEALIIGGFSDIWNKTDNKNKGHRFIMMTNDFIAQGMYPITRSSEMPGYHKILNQELFWSIVTYGHIQWNEENNIHETDYDGAMAIIENHFGPKISVRKLLEMLVSKEFQSEISSNEN